MTMHFNLFFITRLEDSVNTIFTSVPATDRPYVGSGNLMVVIYVTVAHVYTPGVVGNGIVGCAGPVEDKLLIIKGME